MSSPYYQIWKKGYSIYSYPTTQKKAARVHHRSQKLLSTGFKIQYIYTEVKKSNTLQAGLPSAVSQIEDLKYNLNCASNPHSLELEHFCQRADLSLAIVLQNSVFKGNLQKMGSFETQGDEELWRDISGSELFGRFQWILSCKVWKSSCWPSLSCPLSRKDTALGQAIPSKDPPEKIHSFHLSRRKSKINKANQQYKFKSARLQSSGNKILWSAGNVEVWKCSSGTWYLYFKA